MKTVTPSNNLEELREKINQADEQLLQTLSLRIDIAKQIGEYKRANNMEILQAKRWQEVLKNKVSMAQSIGLNTCFIERIYNLIHQESIAVQASVKNELPATNS
ncbi:MAG TPA: chorismate mutase [Bacteroidia bacterium]|jgi:chorismate mutase|nr:chorismate mutase [Bacteroidia bacterium]